MCFGGGDGWENKVPKIHTSDTFISVEIRLKLFFLTSCFSRHPKTQFCVNYMGSQDEFVVSGVQTDYQLFFWDNLPQMVSSRCFCGHQSLFEYNESYIGSKSRSRTPNTPPNEHIHLLLFFPFWVFLVFSFCSLFLTRSFLVSWEESEHSWPFPDQFMRLWDFSWNLKI